MDKYHAFELGLAFGRGLMINKQAVSESMATDELQWITLKPKGQESEGALRADASFEEGFCLSFTAAFQPDFSDGEILAIDDVLSVSLRWQKPGENDGQNYAAFPLADGRVPVVV